MTDIDILFGNAAGPREHRWEKVQIMGSPEQDWSLVFTPEVVEAFLRSRMASVTVSAPETSLGETNIEIDYSFPPGWDIGESYGSMRTAPTGGLSFDALSFGMTFDLLEHILREFPQNKDIVVIFSEFRALFHRANMPRNEGIFRLQNAFHVDLTRTLFPQGAGDD
ncbi:hypothetical protein [uncultured Tateyamaria sp.]|uniref:hypothetical protein n=1 Tax=Tateyamaria sp. 1078 TaxID=3417464 RepID=UPI00263047B6|nr:hypothetical protein [uncultured Tateyamaria sp.]